MKKVISVISLVLALALMASCSSNKTDFSMSAQPRASSYAPPTGMDNYNNYNEADGYYGNPEEELLDDWRNAPIDETEEYAFEHESPFKDARTSQLSTFSANVDTASYSNMRRYITNGAAPVGVRIEELVNYFDYAYPVPSPDSSQPFSITSEISECPWSENHLLAMIGIQGAKLENTNQIANNIVFLIDVSGSMESPNKLPLVIESFKLLLERLDDNDIISIVTYAGSDRIVADSVSGADRGRLTRIISNLAAGGSTAGARGLKTAYDLAAKNFIEGGNNRIILATDGDFNVGVSSVEALTSLIEKEREKGIFISVLGYGMGNLKDNTMEAIASNGNGNYAYIDTIQEAKKVLVNEFDSTMFTIAKDVKLQVEFNPETISAYRLIGYDTRRLENEDFNNDLKDAGDIGSGHNVTAFYELIPVGVIENNGSVDPLKYSNLVTSGSDDFMTVRIRYKEPSGSESKLVEHVVRADDLQDMDSEDFEFASAVVEFGLIVTASHYVGESSLSSVLSRAGSSLGDDDYGMRAEFLGLVEQYGQITKS